MQYEGLIREILKKYKLDYEEYYDVALIGLAKAYKNFDESKGYKFHTLAYNCIKNSLLQQIQTDNYQKRKGSKTNVSIYTKLSEDFEIIDTLKSEDNVEQEVITKQLKELVNKYIDKLDFEQKYYIELRYFSTCKPKEIQEVFNLTSKEEYKFHRRCLTKLKKLMKGEIEQWLD